MVSPYFLHYILMKEFENAELQLFSETHFIRLHEQKNDIGFMRCPTNQSELSMNSRWLKMENKGCLLMSMVTGLRETQQ